MTCLCLGPQGAGKSLLLKQLQNQPVTDITVTIETVGTNIATIFESSTNKSKRKEKDGIVVREVGGSMAPLWPSYYNSSIKTIIFVIDSSNLFQVSISTVMLMEILSHEKLTQTKILITLTKRDLSTTKKLNYLKFMMRLENIIQESDKRVTVEEISSLTGDGVENVRNWIFTNSLPKSRTATTATPTRS